MNKFIMKWKSFAHIESFLKSTEQDVIVRIYIIDKMLRVSSYF